MNSQVFQSPMIIEFPFRMNWIAAVKGGDKMLSIFWNTVSAMNDMAIKRHSITETDKQMLKDLNELFAKWDLPIFPIEADSNLPLFEPEILPFPN